MANPFCSSSGFSSYFLREGGANIITAVKGGSIFAKFGAHVVSLQTKKPPVQFQGYITDTIESCREENHLMASLSAVTSFLSQRRYPPPTLLYTIMEDFLLVRMSAII